jgi:cytochrome c peroxidase
MQVRARLLLRHAGLVALAAGTLGTGCGREGPLSDEELAQLRAYTLRADPPADASNAFGDLVAAAQLGKLLYFERGFAGELRAPYNVAPGANGALGAAGERGKVSCADCHDPAAGGADPRSQPSATSLGSGYTTRNAPTVINAAYAPLWQFWDGHADSLWSQALAPPEGETECNGSRLGVVHVLEEKYRLEFERAFGAGTLPNELQDRTRFPEQGKPGTVTGCQRGDATANEPFDDAFDCMSSADKAIVNGIYVQFGKAIAAYERRLVSGAFAPSPFDRFMEGDAQAMSPAAIRGARLFVGRAGCAECHRGPTFSDFAFHNIGVPQTGEYVPAVDLGRSAGIKALMQLTGADGVNNDQFNFTRQSLYSDQPDDRHIAALGSSAPGSSTPASPTDGQFKTPTLRNVARTAPYMHDGAYKTLWDVVNHYNFGGATGPYSGRKDPALAPLLLTDAEQGDLVEFLRALDDGPAKDTADFPDGLVTRPPAR